jgi:hypothetical protein
MQLDNPLIVQSDRSLLLHTVRALTGPDGRPAKDADGRPLTEEHPRFAAARDALSAFAELEKSPDYLHSYRITPVSVWNAAALGMGAAEIEATLHEYACVPVPAGVLRDVSDWIARYGLLRIERTEEAFELVSEDPDALSDVLGHRSVADLLGPDRLRRGAPAARAGVPAHRRDPGAPPPRADRHAGARGRPRGRRVQPDRPQALRRALEGAGAQGWIATADCCEVRCDLPEGERMDYALAEPRALPAGRHHPAKDAVVRAILANCTRRPALVIGQYLDQLERIAADLGAPLITGRHPAAERERSTTTSAPARLTRLVVSKVGNFAIDLPDAACSSRSRAPSARARRRRSASAASCGPRRDGAGATFYTLVTRDTDEEFAHHRQRS